MDDGATIGLVAALIGVSGGVIAAMTAAFITYLATVRAARATYNLGAIERERDFAGQMIEAAEEQYVLLGNILRGVQAAITEAQAAVDRGETPDVEYRHDKELTDRLAAATAAWRKVLARRALYGLGHLGDALTAFDQARAALASAINEPDTPRARQILDDMDQGALRLLHLAVAVTAAHANVLIASSVLAGPERRRAMKAHQANEEKCVKGSIRRTHSSPRGAWAARGVSAASRGPHGRPPAHGQRLRATWRWSALAADTVVIPIEAVRVGADHGETAERDVAAVEVGWRWRDADARV